MTRNLSKFSFAIERESSEAKQFHPSIPAKIMTRERQKSAKSHTPSTKADFQS